MQIAVVTRVAAVMPGMWECHGHLLGTRTFDLGQLPLEPEALRAARCTRDLRAALDAGITSVRDVGGLGLYLARLYKDSVGLPLYIVDERNSSYRELTHG